MCVVSLRTNQSRSRWTVSPVRRGAGAGTRLPGTVAVRAQVVDRLVTGAAEEFVLIGVAEDLQGGGVEEGDSSRGIDNVQGIGDGRDGPEERLRILRQLGSRDHASIVAQWPADRPAGPTPGGLLAAATQPAASRNVGRVTDRRRSWRWRR